MDEQHLILLPGMEGLKLSIYFKNTSGFSNSRLLQLLVLTWQLNSWFWQSLGYINRELWDLGTVDYYLRERKSSRNLPKNYNAAVVV